MQQLKVDQAQEEAAEGEAAIVEEAAVVEEESAVAEKPVVAEEAAAQEEASDATAERKQLIADLEDQHALTGLMAPDEAVDWTDEQVKAFFESDGEVIPN